MTLRVLVPSPDAPVFTNWLDIEIPGEPLAQGRGRAVGYQRTDGSIGARVFDPQKSRNWKATAQQHYRDAMAGRSPLQGPVALDVTAYFTCPKSEHRKTVPQPERWHAKKPDADNVLKAIKDSAKGVLWLDDSQVATVHVVKRIAAQGEAPCILVRVRALGPA